MQKLLAVCAFSLLSHSPLHLWVLWLGLQSSSYGESEFSRWVFLRSWHEGDCNWWRRSIPPWLCVWLVLFLCIFSKHCLFTCSLFSLLSTYPVFLSLLLLQEVYTVHGAALQSWPLFDHCGWCLWTGTSGIPLICTWHHTRWSHS